MDETVKIEQAVERGQSLAQVEEQFRRWRESRKAGGRIPPPLWAAAMELSRVHGLHRISKELRLDYSGLKRRLEGAGGDVRPGKPAARFVEMFAAPASTAAGLHECVVELENARGAKMRVQLNGAGLAGLASMCSALWSAP